MLKRHDVSIEQVIGCDELTDVVIRIPRGSITILCEPTRTDARIKSNRFAEGISAAAATGRASEIKLDVTRNGPKLTIEATLPLAPQDQPLGVDLVVQLPAKLNLDLTCDQGDVELRNPVGSVSIKSRIGAVDVIDHTGDLTVDANRGDVSLRNISGTVHAKVGTGDLEAYRVGNISARTRVGEIRLYHPRGTVELQTTQRGRVLIQAPKLAREPQVKVTTAVGEVKLEVPSSVRCHLMLRSGRGLVTAFIDQVKVTNRVSSENSFVANLNGGGGKITVRTSDGAIHIESVGQQLSK